MSDELRFVSFEELHTRAREDDQVWKQEMREGTAHWGHWWFVPETLVLKFRDDNGRSIYEVDLECCNSGREILDWIFHINGKAWATPEDIGQLVAALHQILPIWTMIPNPSETHDVRTIIADPLGYVGTH